MNVSESIVFVAYLVFLCAVGVYFFYRDRNGGEKTYFLGGRKMGAWVAALSAGASDMSAWVLMGLPTSVYALGLGQLWIAIGLVIGYSLSWIFEAPRLRSFSIVAGDSITVPQYLANRFLTKSYVLQVLSAVVFLLAYTVYSASSMKACGILFNLVMGVESQTAVYVAAVVVVGITFLGGFSAVCWTDFFQGVLIFGAMLIAPAFALGALDTAACSMPDASYWNPVAHWTDIVSGLAWGLGYFGMPHIIIRFMSIKSQKEVHKSAKIGIAWTAFVLLFAAAIGIIGRVFLGFDESVNANSMVFIAMSRKIFPGLICGALLSAVFAASMSTADSQLLAAASAFASDVYKPLLRGNKASDREMLWAGRLVVLGVSAAAVVIAVNPSSGSIMELVTNAWGLFGAAFGPAILLSLFWRRLNLAGTVAGLVAGTVVDVAWMMFCSKTGVYELLPGFAAGFAGAVFVSLCTEAPSAEVQKLFDDSVNYTD